MQANQLSTKLLRAIRDKQNTPSSKIPWLKPPYRALVVGINEYKAPSITNLRGCLEDANNVVRFLTEELGMKRHRILLLTSPALESSELATRAAIIEGLNQTLNQTPAGEEALFYYSGHGSTCAVASEIAFGYQSDNTFVPMDARQNGVLDIMTRELRYLIAEAIEERGVRFTMISDSCHSGKLLRQGAEGWRPRFTPPNRAMRTLDSLLDGTVNYQRLADLYDRRTLPYTLIAGCLPHQSSYEIIRDGKVQGLMTFTLLEVLKNANEPLTYQELGRVMRASISKHRQRHNQYPDIIGEQDRLIFGTDGLPREPEPSEQEEGTISISSLPFDLLIERTRQGYRARVLSSPAGEGASEFRLPFKGEQVNDLLQDLDYITKQELTAFGRQLFEALFVGQIRALLRRSQALAEQQAVELPIRLHLEQVPDLARLPWEALYDSEGSRFLALSTQTSLVRYLPSALPARSLTVKLPLRVLVVIATPHDFEPLDVEREWEGLRSAFSDMVRRGQVVLERMEDATLAALQRQLRRETYHVFHFIGHGSFDEETNQGVLIVEDEEGYAEPVSAERLSILLSDHHSLRLVVLNAAESARTLVKASFSGVAQRLVQRGIPAVIGLQFPITDSAAILFARQFYSALVDGYTADAALTEARKAIYIASDDTYWLAPVLYTNSPDGQLFDLREAATPLRDVVNPGPKALMIGINAYQNLGRRFQLRGCVNDVEILRRVLVTRFGFESDHVRMLINAEATRHNILHELDRLAGMGEYEGQSIVAPSLDGEEGDVVFISFSGYGSKLAEPPEQRDEADGYNSTIVPYDSDRPRPMGKGGPNLDITNDELYARLLRIKQRAGHLVLLFDASHSETISRNLTGSIKRSLPASERYDDVERLNPFIGGRMQAEEWNLPKGLSGWLPLDEGHVLMAACADDEEALEYHDTASGEYYGALTYFLTKELQRVREAAPTYESLFEAVRTAVKTRFLSQTPQLEGESNRLLFDFYRSTESVILVEGRLDDYRLKLPVGTLDDVTVGSIWEIRPAELSENDKLAEVTIRSVSMTSCEAESETALSDSVNEECRAIEIQHALPDIALPVAVHGPSEYQASLSELRHKISQSAVLKLAENEPPSVLAVLLAPRNQAQAEEPEAYAPQMGAIDVPTWVIVGDNQQMRPLPPHTILEQDALELTLSNLETWAGYLNVYQIKPVGADPLRDKAQVQLLSSDSVPLPLHLHTGLPLIEDGQQIRLELTNHHSKPLYYVMYHMNACGSIERIWPPPQAVEPLAAFETLPLEFPLELPESFPKMLPGGRETLKLIVTTKYVDFDEQVSHDAAEWVRTAIRGTGITSVKPLRQAIDDETWTVKQIDYYLEGELDSSSIFGAPESSRTEDNGREQDDQQSFFINQGNAYALLIGIADYHPPGYALYAQGTRELYELLVDPNLAGYPKENVLLLADKEATKANILQALDDLAQRSNPESIVFVFYYGHLTGTDSSEMGLVPVDAVIPVRRSAETMISGAEFAQALRALPARHVLLALDGGYRESLRGGEGLTILAAAGSDQGVYEKQIDGRQSSPFSHYLLSAIRGAVASEDGLIRILDLFEYLQPRVSQFDHTSIGRVRQDGNRNQQEPVLEGDLSQNFPIALYRGGEQGIVDRDEEGFRYDVYLSFADEVASHARQMGGRMRRVRPLRMPYEVWEGVIPILQEAGLRIAISNDVEKTGVARVATPERGIAQSKYRVILLSEAYLAHRRNELDTILAHETEPQRLFLVKMEAIDESQLPEKLANSSIFDLTEPSRTKETFNRLLRALGKARSAIEKTEGETKRALMIGIDKYANLGRRFQLRGCVNDQTLLRTLLIERFGFEASHITLLTNSMATREAILDALDRLAGMGEYEGDPLVEKDDLLLISFTGHGSRVKVPDGQRDKPSGHYSTILPHDANRPSPTGKGGPNLDITDSELFVRLQRLQEQGVYLVLLFDCPHCGGFEIPWGESVFLAACAQSEVSYEFRNPETTEPCGAWSYHIVQQMAQSTENTTYWDVFQPARAKVNAFQKKQMPQLIGDWNRKLFSREEVKVEPFVMVEKRLDDHRVTLAVGEAHGARVGSRWQILPPELAKNEPLAVVTIRLLKGLLSKAESDAPLPEAVNEFCRAREIEHAPDEFRLSVAVEGDHQVAGDHQKAIDELQNMIIQSTRLRLAEKEPPDLVALLLPPRSEQQLREVGEQMSVPELGALTKPTWVIVGQEGQMMQSGAYRLEEADALERLFNDLEMWAHYFKMHEIMPKEANELRGKLKVRLLRRLANGEQTALPRHETSGVPMIDSGDEMQIELTNTHSEPLYVTLFSMDATGAITRLWPPPNAREPIPPSTSFPLVAPFILPDDVLEGLDGVRETLKIMVTLQYVDFATLMQEGGHYGR